MDEEDEACPLLLPQGTLVVHVFVVHGLRAGDFADDALCASFDGGLWLRRDAAPWARCVVRGRKKAISKARAEQLAAARRAPGGSQSGSGNAWRTGAGSAAAGGVVPSMDGNVDVSMGEGLRAVDPGDAPVEAQQEASASHVCAGLADASLVADQECREAEMERGGAGAY